MYLTSLTDGSRTTIEQLADREKIDVSDLSRILRLAFLAPTTTEGSSPVVNPPSDSAALDAHWGTPFWMG